MGILGKGDAKKKSFKLDLTPFPLQKQNFKNTNVFIVFNEKLSAKNTS